MATLRFNPGYCTDTECLVFPHVENCPDCFGFGRTADGRLISAEAADGYEGEYTPCPTCGGAPNREERWQLYKAQ